MKSQIRWIFKNILNMTFQCSLCLDDARNWNQHFPNRACICWICHELFTNYHTVLPAVWFIILALRTSAMLHGFGQKWQPEGISCIMVTLNTSFTTAKCKIFSGSPVSCWNVMLLIFEGPKLASVKFPKNMTELERVRIFADFCTYFNLTVCSFVSGIRLKIL